MIQFFIIQEHIFPRNVVSHEAKSFLNDIVIDPDHEFAFISDSDAGKIVVYSLKDNLSWSIEHSSMKANPRVIIKLRCFLCKTLSNFLQLHIFNKNKCIHFL